MMRIIQIFYFSTIKELFSIVLYGVLTTFFSSTGKQILVGLNTVITVGTIYFNPKGWSKSMYWTVYVKQNELENVHFSSIFVGYPILFI